MSAICSCESSLEQAIYLLIVMQQLFEMIFDDFLENQEKYLIVCLLGL